MSLLPLSFYSNSDVVTVAKNLLGKKLVTKIDGAITAGLITETEAYSGQDDKACHAYEGKKTKRNEVMYQQGGVAYVYLCYGIHHLLNIVTNIENRADAVLVRAIEPIQGLDIMRHRRGNKLKDLKLTTGPGALSEALGIDMSMNGLSLFSQKIWIEDTEIIPEKNEIYSTTRIGIDYAGKDALKLWRFYFKNSPWVSKK